MASKHVEKKMKRGKTMARFLILLIATAMLSLSLTTALELESHQITYDIGKNEVKITQTLQFSEELSQKEVFTIPRDAQNIEITSQTTSIEVEFEKGVLKLPKGYKEFTIEYSTKEVIQASNTKNFFATTIETLYPTKILTISAKLPKRSALTAPIDDGRSVFPPPTNTSTDGQRIIITWEDKDLEPGDVVGVFLTYTLAGNYLFLFVGLIGLLIAVIGVYIVYKRRRKEKPTPEPSIEEKPKTEEKPKVEETEFEEHLKEEERLIVNVLRQKEGKCQQSTLVILTGYSKAHLSRILQEMEARKLITKAIKGNKNIILLNEKLKELDEI